MTKNELLDSVWGDRFAGESASTSRIKSARRLLGDDGIAQSVIHTVHGRGYRWVADVAVDEAEKAPAASVPAQGSGRRDVGAGQQQIRFCRSSDGARIAYATSARVHPSYALPTGSPISTTTSGVPHGCDELRIPFDEGREYASLIRGSRLVPLDTRNHLIRPDEPAWEHLLSELDDFLGLPS